MTISGKTAVIALAAALAACGGGDGSQANQVAAPDSMNMAAAASGPFSDAEKRMDEAMMAAVGPDVGQTWARKMIAHHEGAIAMSGIAIEQNARAEVAQMARMDIDTQRKDIADIQKLVQEGAPDQRSAELFRPAMMDMHRKMQAASGADLSETYLRKMLEHHRGAVVMSDVALRHGVSGALRQQAQKTRNANQKETQMVEAMLRGEPMDHAMHGSTANPAGQEKAAPAPAKSAEAARKPEPAIAPTTAKVQPKATPTAEPKAVPPAPATACEPEHRAAGHC